MINKNLFYALAINLYFMGLCFFWGNLRYGAVDDFFMAGILSGIFGNGYNVHLTFVNALYGYCLLPLYCVFPQISWYYIGEVFSVFVSLVLVSYVLIKMIGQKWGVVLTMLLLTAFANDFYLVLQFTQCAAVLTAAGMLVFVYGFEKSSSLENNFKSSLCAVIGILLMWWGSWMRWESFLMGLPLFGCVLFALTKQILKNKVKLVMCLLFLFVGAFGFHEFDKSLYRNEAYAKYMDFQGPRAILGDGAYYNHQAVYEDLEEFGYSGKDFAQLKNWNFYDSEVFAPESIRIVTNVIERYTNKMYLRNFPVYILTLLRTSSQRPVFIIWLLFSLVLFLSSPKKWFWPWMSFLITSLLLAFLFFRLRLVYRVEICLWFYAIVLTIPFFKQHLKMSKKIFVGIVLFLCLLNLYVYAISATQTRSVNTGDVVDDPKDTVDYVGFLNFADSTSDSTVFLMATNTYVLLSDHKLPPYLTEPQGSWERVISLGFWTPYFPDVENALRKRGISNPLKDVVLNNVYVVDESSLKDFLEQHHYENVKIDTVRNFNGMMVYKYSLDSKSLIEIQK